MSTFNSKFIRVFFSVLVIMVGLATDSHADQKNVNALKNSSLSCHRVTFSVPEEPEKTLMYDSMKQRFIVSSNPQAKGIFELSMMDKEKGLVNIKHENTKMYLTVSDANKENAAYEAHPFALMLAPVQHAHGTIVQIVPHVKGALATDPISIRDTDANNAWVQAEFVLLCA